MNIPPDLGRKIGRASRELLEHSEAIIAAYKAGDFGALHEIATRSYRATHGGLAAPAELSQWDMPDPTSLPLVELGALVSLTYRTQKGRKKTYDFEHAFNARKRPVLVYNGERKLLIAGGGYIVTEAGIEG